MFKFFNLRRKPKEIKKVFSNVDIEILDNMAKCLNSQKGWMRASENMSAFGHFFTYGHVHNLISKEDFTVFIFKKEYRCIIKTGIYIVGDFKVNPDVSFSKQVTEYFTI